MAQFKYLGEPARSYVKTYGPLLQLRVPRKNGPQHVLTKVGGFPIGNVITDSDGNPVDFTDERSLRVLRADTRYEEVV